MVHFQNFCDETAIADDAKVKNHSLPGTSLDTTLVCQG